MENKTIFKLAFGGLALVVVILFFGGFASFSNGELALRTSFDQKQLERTAFYDNMTKTISMVTQVSVKNDESFRKNVDIVMAGRKDAEQVMMKWITESNPNANYQEVSKMYQNLARVIESQRIGFFNQEKVLQDIVRQHTYFINSFPNGLYNIFFGRKPLEYKVIQSDQTKQVMETGIDNNTKLDL